MKNENESYLSKINFEYKVYLLSLYESINKSPLDNLMTTIKPFMSMLSSLKLKLKAEEHPSIGLPKEEVLSAVKVFLILSEICFQHNAEIESNFVIDSSLLINDIYKLITFFEGCKLFG